MSRAPTQFYNSRTQKRKISQLTKEASLKFAVKFVLERWLLCYGTNKKQDYNQQIQVNITYVMKQRLKLGIWLQEKVFVENINIIERIGWLGEQKSSKLLEKKMFLN